MATEDMVKRLQGNKELASKIIPSFPLGCRRPTPGNGFLERFVGPSLIADVLTCSYAAYCSLSKDHVEPITESIQAITQTGITLKGGRHVEADV